MSRLGPRIDASWTRSGWVVESAHVPGSFRMLALWGASFLSIPVVIAVLDGPLGLHTAMCVALLVAVAGIAAGVAVYTRVSRTLEVPAAERWEVGPSPQAWPSLDRPVLARPGVLAAAVAEGRVRGQEEHALLAAELGVNVGIVDEDQADDVASTVLSWGAR